MEKNNRIYKKKGSVQKQTDEELWFSASVADDTHSYDVNSAFERLQRRMKGPTRRSWLQRYRIALCAAAAIALLLFVSTTSYKQAEQNFEQRFAHITVEAPLKSKSKVTLPDGSLVWLNGGSQIVYSQGFGVTERTVTFKGEAFFEIEKNAQLPFKVHTADLTVTVLGTKFNFRNYADDEEVIVNLMEGKVALKNHLKSMVSQYLAPSEQMILNKKTGDLRIVSADADTGKMWMEEDATWTSSEGKTPVTIIKCPQKPKAFDPQEHLAVYEIYAPAPACGNEETRMYISYKGNIANAYLNGKLVHDSFYDGTDWILSLSRLKERIDHIPLTIRLKGLKSAEDLIYFEQNVNPNECVIPSLSNVRIVQEYRFTVTDL